MQYGLILSVLAVLVVFTGWRLVSGERTTAEASIATGSAPAALILDSHGQRAEATPLFARYRSLHLYLPMDPESVTAVAFHQASGELAQALESLLPDADMTAAKASPASNGVAVETDEAGLPTLDGSALRMWRSNRTGQPDTAADIGAPAGAPVYSPVTGTVIEVRPYRLYDKHDDYEIHIQPSGWPEIAVVLIHVDGPTVKAGDPVFGGITQVASVRLLSDRVDHQLSTYTPDGGDHVHIQLNRVETPGQIGGIGGGS
jgi:murein DD-endopeptidase MepM/ murein hydrolase activator NlpD